MRTRSAAAPSTSSGSTPGLSNGEAAEWLVSELGIPIEAKRQPQQRRRIVATYDYRDEAGELVFQVVRYEPKDFRQRRPDGQGGWTWQVKGVRQVPYRLFELRANAADDPGPHRRGREGRRSPREPRLRRHLQRRRRQQVAGRAEPALPGRSPSTSCRTTTTPAAAMPRRSRRTCTASPPASAS